MGVDVLPPFLSSIFLCASVCDLRASSFDYTQVACGSHSTRRVNLARVAWDCWSTPGALGIDVAAGWRWVMEGYSANKLVQNKR